MGARGPRERQARESEYELAKNDRLINTHARRMVDEQADLPFRYLRLRGFLRRCLGSCTGPSPGEENGGVGAGVSPKTALAVGLQVDADALPEELKASDQGGRVNLDDPRQLSPCSIECRPQGDRQVRRCWQIRSMGIMCAFCHSTSITLSPPESENGWTAGQPDLNVGLIVSLAPNLIHSPISCMSDVATVKAVLNSWGPGRYDAILDKDGKALPARWRTSRHADSARVRSQPA